MKEDYRNEIYRNAVEERDAKLVRVKSIRTSLAEGSVPIAEIEWALKELERELDQLESNLMPDH